MTATVHVHRADPARTTPVPAAVIAVVLPQPTHGADYATHAQAMFYTDALKIADALQAALPGGTWTALLAEMLTRQGCLLRVPMASAEETK